MVEVFDDLLDDETYKLLHNLITDEEFYWRWVGFTVRNINGSLYPNDTFQFVRPLFLDCEADPAVREKAIEADKDPYNEISRKYPEVFNISYKALERSERQFDGIEMFLRIKANLLTPVPNSPRFHPPHEDSDDHSMMSCLYYLHDSDGDTWFFPSGEQGFTVSPKANRAVLFDSRIKHASSNPITTERRMIINSVFRPKYS